MRDTELVLRGERKNQDLEKVRLDQGTWESCIGLLTRSADVARVGGPS